MTTVATSVGMDPKANVTMTIDMASEAIATMIVDTSKKVIVMATVDTSKKAIATMIAADPAVPISNAAALIAPSSTRVAKADLISTVAVLVVLMADPVIDRMTVPVLAQTSIPNVAAQVAPISSAAAPVALNSTHAALVVLTADLISIAVAPNENLANLKIMTTTAGENDATAMMTMTTTVMTTRTMTRMTVGKTNVVTTGNTKTIKREPQQSTHRLDVA